MNKQRRKKIAEVIDLIDKSTESLEYIRELIEEISNEESEYRDSIPDNLQGSERYELAVGNTDSLEEASSFVGEALEGLSNALDSLGEIE